MTNTFIGTSDTTGCRMILGIYGAGGLGHEIYILARQINAINKKWSDIIFIDDNPNPNEFKGISPIAFDLATAKYSSQTIEFIITVGEPRFRKLLRNKISDCGYLLAKLIHPEVYIDDSVQLGDGVIICSNCFVSCSISIGDNVLIQPNASIGHDCTIGKDSVLSTNVCIAGSCSIGSETYIGMQVPIKEGTQIGSNSIVGMGSVVIRDIPDHVIALGNPARPMKENIEEKVFKKN